MPMFSPTLRKFYDDGQPVPADAVVVAEEARAAIIDAVNHGGKILTVDGAGKPVVADRPLPSPAALAAQKLTVVNREYNRVIELALSEFPAAERLGWDEQIRAVEQFEANPNGDNVLLDMLASGNGRTRLEQAQKIKERRNQFLMLYAALTSTRHMLERQVQQAATLPEAQALATLNAINTDAFAAIVAAAQQ